MAASEKFEAEGYSGPVDVLSPEECRKVMSALRAERDAVKPMTWGKGFGPTSPTYYGVASDPRVLALVTPILGDDVILWGASPVVRRDNAVHVFHSDVESCGPEGGFVTIWLGTENVTRESGLKFIPGSHRYPSSVQESNTKRGITRALTSDEATLDGARIFDPKAEIIQPDVHTGSALVFDGRIWHGSHNASTAVRTALLLQYARADRPVYVPAGYDWPFEKRYDKRPPVVVVSGKAPNGVNRVAPPPAQMATASS